MTTQHLETARPLIGRSPSELPTPLNLSGHDVWRLRNDLRFHWVNGIGAAGGYWVVKDPFACEWYCLTTNEKKLLDLAKGCLSIQELCRDAMTTIKPLETSFDAMLSFYAQARRNGLLVSVGRRGPVDQALAVGMATAVQREKTSWVGKIIAFRFPGFNPNAWPESSPSVKRLANSRMVSVAAAAIMVIAIAMVVGKFDVLATELASAIPRRDPLWLMLLLGIIGVTKSIHEAAHALACRSVGAECREIGVMLLFGTPCLYCDVSDLWSVPSRRHRVFVSAAGMLAELLLAAIAAIVWAATNPSTLHDLALVVMMVCSVSTVMINANPLLRYDGYFILADWIGVPNLSQQAGATLRGVARRIVWGKNAATDETLQVGRVLPPTVLLFYAVASSAYRMFVVGVISLLIYHTSVEFGLGWLGAAFGIVLLGSMISRASTQVLQPPASDSSSGLGKTPPHARRRWWKQPRAVALVTIVGLLMLLVMLIPLRRHVVVPILAVAAGQREIHVTQSGCIVQLAESGTFVRSGDVLLRLKNEDLEDQLGRADAELSISSAVVQAWESRKGGKLENSAALALSVNRRDAAQKNRQQLAKRVEELTMIARSTGRFTHSIPRPVEAYDRRFRSGQWIPSGTLVGWVGHPRDRNAIALTDQNQIDLVRDGQDVRIRHASLSNQRLTGIVRQVDRTARQSVPPELLTAGDGVIDSPNSPNANYLVRIELSTPETISLPLRTVSIAEITVESASIWDRLYRIVASEYRGL